MPVWPLLPPAAAVAVVVIVSLDVAVTLRPVLSSTATSPSIAASVSLTTTVTATLEPSAVLPPALPSASVTEVMVFSAVTSSVSALYREDVPFTIVWASLTITVTAVDAPSSGRPRELALLCTSTNDDAAMVRLPVSARISLSSMSTSASERTPSTLMTGHVPVECVSTPADSVTAPPWIVAPSISSDAPA